MPSSRRTKYRPDQVILWPSLILITFNLGDKNWKCVVKKVEVRSKNMEVRNKKSEVCSKKSEVRSKIRKCVLNIIAYNEPSAGPSYLSLTSFRRKLCPQVKSHKNVKVMVLLRETAI